MWGRNSDHERHFVGGPLLPQSKYNMADRRHLEIDMTSYFRSGWSDLDEIRQPDAEWHADYGEIVENETGSRIIIWRTFVFPNRM